MTLSYPEVMKTGADGAHETEFWRPVRQAPRIYVILRVAPPPEGSGVVLKVSKPGPSLRSGRQSKVLRVAQDDNQPETGAMTLSF